MVRTLRNGLLVLLAVLFLLKAYSSLDWRMEHDSPLLHYVAWLMDEHDAAPYRDVFETSMPGTFAFHTAVVKLCGYGDTAFRWVDLTLLAALLAVTVAFMRRFGRAAAVLAALLFGLMYFSQGQIMSLQRDYLGVIPVAFALLCIPGRARAPVPLVRFAIVGLLFGLSVLIKPHAVIMLPVVFGALLVLRRETRTRSTGDVVACVVVCAAALLVPVVIALVWLAARDALGPFLDIAFNYLPLHNAMTGEHETVFGMDRVRYLVAHALAFGGFGTLFAAALFGCYHVATHAPHNRAITVSWATLALCVLATAIYPIPAGKFWWYHYFPFLYFVCLTAALCWVVPVPAVPEPPLRRVREWLLVAVVVVVAAVQLSLYDYAYALAFDLRQGREAHAPRHGRVDEMAAFLETHLEPGDTVQPLDWTGGSIHAMLVARARLATRFMYDYHFYYRVSSPYVQGLRAEFLDELGEENPRFVIEVTERKPWVSGHDTTREFPELRRFLNSHYHTVFTGEGYAILERSGPRPE